MNNYLEKAKEIAGLITEKRWQSNALNFLCRITAEKTHDFEAALELARSIDNPGQFYSTLCSITVCCMSQGEVEKAVEIVFSIPDLEERVSGLIDILLSLEEKSCIDPFIEMIVDYLTSLHGEVGGQLSFDRSCRRFARECLFTGRIDLATRLADLIEDFSEQNDLIVNIVYAYCKEGNIEKAIEMAAQTSLFDAECYDAICLAYLKRFIEKCEKKTNISAIIDFSSLNEFEQTGKN
ncbi:MAG: hypothetical protein P0S96_05370 [Simkaniaceae bacterium]|nr:hypothetical protein [Candidatus Sacchlamyda saccharinae]